MSPRFKHPVLIGIKEEVKEDSSQYLIKTLYLVDFNVMTYFKRTIVEVIT